MEIALLFDKPSCGQEIRKRKIAKTKELQPPLAASGRWLEDQKNTALFQKNTALFQKNIALFSEEYSPLFRRIQHFFREYSTLFRSSITVTFKSLQSL